MRDGKGVQTKIDFLHAKDLTKEVSMLAIDSAMNSRSQN